MRTAASKRRIIYFYVAYTVVFTLLAACGYYISYEKDALVQHQAAVATNSFVTDLTYLDMPRMTIALGGDTKSHVRLDLSLEVAKKDVARVQGYQPLIMDGLNGFFLHIDPDQFRNATELAWLRAQMLMLVNNAVPVPVHDLLLRQMIIM